MEVTLVLFDILKKISYLCFMEKYYIVPAEIFESNFPEEYEDLLLEGDVSAFYTNVDIKKIAEVLNKEE